jgi:hypothetical protein
MTVAVVLAFFQPVSFELPRRHFHAVLHTLHAQGVPLVVAQAVFPGQQPQPVPACIPQISLPTRSLLFHKERLWNIAATMLTDADRLIFLDADVVPGSTDWLAQCTDELERCDILQPFSEAVWLDETGRPEMHREPITEALRTGKMPKLTHFHPGFGWGMTRCAYEALGGLFDASVAGNSDTLQAFSLSDTKCTATVESWFHGVQDPSIGAESYKRYKANALNLGLRIGHVEGVTMTHLWHGHRKHRQYVTRGKLFPRRANGEYAVHTDDNGLQEWDDISGANRAAEAYFLGKRDDG